MARCPWSATDPAAFRHGEGCDERPDARDGCDVVELPSLGLGVEEMAVPLPKDDKAAVGDGFLSRGGADNWGASLWAPHFRGLRLQLEMHFVLRDDDVAGVFQELGQLVFKGIAFFCVFGMRREGLQDDVGEAKLVEQPLAGALLEFDPVPLHDVARKTACNLRNWYRQ